MEDQRRVHSVVGGVPMDAQQNHVVVSRGDLLFDAAIEPQGSFVEEQRAVVC